MTGRKPKQPLRLPPTPVLQAIFRISDDRGPKQLVLLPVYLRKRSKYYEDALRRAWKRIEWAYRPYESKYSLEEFAASADAEYWWRTPFVPWWGIGDIFGFIDVRFSLDKWEIRLSCFLTIKRPAHNVVDRAMAPRFSITKNVPKEVTNPDITKLLLELLDEAKGHTDLKQRYVEDRDVRELIPNVDWVSYLSGKTPKPK